MIDRDVVDCVAVNCELIDCCCLLARKVSFWKKYLRKEPDCFAKILDGGDFRFTQAFYMIYGALPRFVNNLENFEKEVEKEKTNGKYEMIQQLHDLDILSYATFQRLSELEKDGKKIFQFF